MECNGMDEDQNSLFNYKVDAWDEDEEDDSSSDSSEMERGPLIRSTSLKTGKTPPGTPSAKKFVRFADSLGLDMIFVKSIHQDDLPTVPKSAYSDLSIDQEEYDQAKTMTKTQLMAQNQANLMGNIEGSPNKLPSWFNNCRRLASVSNNQMSLTPEFIQPFIQMNFLDRVRAQKICLEYCMVSSGAGNISITCVTRVLNIAFEKQVFIRYSPDNWKTWKDALASHIPHSSDGWSDKFSVTFSVSRGLALRPGHLIMFALRYVTNGEEFWDNNMGMNYTLICRS